MELIALFMVTLLLAYANGANDNFKACATIYASKTLSYRASLLLATAAQVTGSIASVVLAGALLKAFSGKGLVPDAILADPHFLLAVGLGGAGAVGLATLFGLPISTTHALVGGLVGGGIAFAPGELMWANLRSVYLLPLLTSPLLALLATAALYPAVSRLRKRLGVDATTCVCVDTNQPMLANSPDGASVAHRTTLALAVSTNGQCATEYRGSVFGVSAQRIADGVHVISAFALGLARGLNDTPKVLGILVAAGYLGGNIGPGVFAAAAAAMAIGGLLHSRKLATTLGERITTMNTGQGLLANCVSSSMVIGASLLGMPVSTTHISTGAIFGIAAWSGTANHRMIGGIVAAWVFTLPLAALLACGISYAIGR